MYLASPMPKVIDQAYSSLTTILQRQKANTLVIPQPVVLSRSEPLITPPPKISPSNTDNTKGNQQTATLDDASPKRETPISSLMSCYNDFNGQEQIEGDTLRTPEPTVECTARLVGDNGNYTPSGSPLPSRKRKSTSQRTQTVHEPATKRRRVSKISPNTEPYPRDRSSSHSSPPTECEDSHRTDATRVRIKLVFTKMVLITSVE